MKTTRRAIPAVGKVIEALGPCTLPQALSTLIVRQHLSSLRASGKVPAPGQIIRDVESVIADLSRSRLQPVINGTGILIHTNFGRAPLAREALRAIEASGRDYNNLEFDLKAGVRGRRGEYVERALARLCHAESVCLVNNCAAALVLMAHHFTRKKRDVIISRGELVQIGGGFRVGEILESAGAILREVGATNKTTLGDYARAISPETALILKVHRSNFFMSGFVGSPATVELATLARKRRVPFVEDLGSGAIPGTESLGTNEHEPTPAETLRAGADLVCFSGDKLFGGPQAGIVAGKRRFVTALKRDPLFRAVRCDKLILSALQATAELHLEKNFSAIPILRLLQTPLKDLRKRVERIVAALVGSDRRPRRSRRDNDLNAEIAEVESRIGGGALPRSKIPSIALTLISKEISAQEMAERLGKASPPVVGYVSRNSLVLDLRTIFPEQDETLVSAIHEALR
jgi:L-seryl-tRNA(Ser) seleniumtransferase